MTTSLMAPILAGGATRGPPRSSGGARDRALPPLRAALPAAPPGAGARRRGRGGGARDGARGLGREPLAARVGGERPAHGALGGGGRPGVSARACRHARAL